MKVNRSTIQAVVFDLDDTLYAERQYVRSGYRAVTNHLGPRLGRDADELTEWLWGRFLAGRSDRAFDALVGHFGLDLSDEDIAELVTLYRQHAPTIAPFPGVSELLSALGERYRLGLLSDGYLPGQQLKLQALRLRHCFHAVLFTEELGRDCWKPSPDGFEAIRTRFDVPHSGCCYVADNPAKDFVAANALGWRTVQLRWPEQLHADNPAPPAGSPQLVAWTLNGLQTALE